MSEDIVIDTNVFAHCDNTVEARASAARALVSHLRASSDILCVDEGFTTDEAANRSRIGSEYLQHLLPGSMGFTAVVALATQGRVRMVDKRAPKLINQQIVRIVTDPGDRAFLGVAYNSDRKLLVSHDFVDLSSTKRRDIRRFSGIVIREAAEALATIAAGTTGGLAAGTG